MLRKRVSHFQQDCLSQSEDETGSTLQRLAANHLFRRSDPNGNATSNTNQRHAMGVMLIYVNSARHDPAEFRTCEIWCEYVIRAPVRPSDT